VLERSVRRAPRVSERDGPRGERVSTPERRQHRRIRAPQLASHLKLHDEVVGLALSVDDISMGGLFVRHAPPLPVGSLVSLELHHPKLPRPLHVSGRVVSLLQGVTAAGARAGMGVRFDALSLRALTQLSRLLQELVTSGAASPLPSVVASATVPPAGGAGALTPPPPPLEAFDVDGDGMDPDAPTTRIEPLSAGLLEMASAVQERRASVPPDAPWGPPLAAQEPELSALPEPEEPSSGPLSGPVLMVQVRGLLMQLGDAHSRLSGRERELAQLQQENERLRQELTLSQERIRSLEQMLRAQR
jgi:Tfp pilus assembly protein PilZ